VKTAVYKNALLKVLIKKHQRQSTKNKKYDHYNLYHVWLWLQNREPFLIRLNDYNKISINITKELAWDNPSFI
jgi:hypothetical protein